MKTAKILLTAAVLLSVTGAAQAALVAALNGQIVNDTDRNIAWVADAGLAWSNTFGLKTGVDLGPVNGDLIYGGSYIYDTGVMTWGGAQKWIGAMNAANYLGYNDWRLPTTLQPDGSCGRQLTGGSSTVISMGYNCTGSEMGHLFYKELGGQAGMTISVTHNANYNLFQNLWSGTYWSGTEYCDVNYQPALCSKSAAFIFYTNYGVQDYYGITHNGYNAMAVRDGQVGAVPVPAAAWLLGSGLLGLVGVARRKAA